MGIFGILALLLWRAIAGTTAWRRPWAWALAFAVLYAVTDELHQGGVTGRHAAAVDSGCDATGALIALVAVGLIRSRRSWWRAHRPPPTGTLSAWRQPR